ncbi:excisionase family DNA binding protein [Allocatelliglobosispora scoriae]|uniref:Excisionase family DNA binding protein n=1 Tax=Allocatelliglobosispora scoriae TaxID=643052 RepID=A0A841BP12_9ACTN|nr:helix-turn-helix domain-containing protein [Allocatelliglobosispora scoriae]MBB5868693.1 excisionase family DNA binding protein [Allocatelliglobosispora scoriae]
MTAIPLNAEPPSARVIEVASQALDRVRSYLRNHPDGPQEVHIVVADSPHDELSVPREAVVLLARVLSHLAEGHGVAVLPMESELTSQQAADLLNVSRPFLIGLLDAGEIRYRMVGSHRRIELKSLMDYQRADDARTLRAANDLTALDEELGFI